MGESKLRIVVCEHTNKEVVQEKYGDEWVCIHKDTTEEDQELVEQLKQVKPYGKSGNISLTSYTKWEIAQKKLKKQSKNNQYEKHTRITNR